MRSRPEVASENRRHSMFDLFHFTSKITRISQDIYLFVNPFGRHYLNVFIIYCAEQIFEKGFFFGAVNFMRL